MSVQTVNRIISHLVTDGSFNRVFKVIEAIAVDDKCLTCRFKVTQEEANSFHTLHGGFIVGATDFISSVDLIRFGHKKHVSVNLAASASKLDSLVKIESYICKKGKNLAFCEVSFIDEQSGELIARGTHTKYMMD